MVNFFVQRTVRFRSYRAYNFPDFRIFVYFSRIKRKKSPFSCARLVGAIGQVRAKGRVSDDSREVALLFRIPDKIFVDFQTVDFHQIWP